MSGLLRFVFLLALALWIGEIVFFSFVVAPSIFGVLDAAHAGQAVGAILPRYYSLGANAALVALVAAAMLAQRAATPGPWAAASACIVLGLATTLWAGAVVQPRAQLLRTTLQASGRAPMSDPDFQRLHRNALLLNGAALVAGLAGLGLSAAAFRH